MADFEYPEDVNGLKKYLIHLDPNSWDEINRINEKLHDIVGFNMLRLINGGKDIEKLINKDHTETCWAETYT